MSWCAYVDESMRQRPDANGIYVLAAAVLPFDHLEAVRDALVDLRQGKRRFHWRMEESRVQRSAVSTIGAIDLMHVAVVGSRLDNARQERGRRICLERLLWELDQLGVASVTMDRRSGHLNARDLALVDAMRARNTLGHWLRIDFQPSFDGVDGEILLWIPDVVAGAITAAQGDGRPEFLGPIARQVVDITVDLGGQSAKPRS